MGDAREFTMGGRRYRLVGLDGRAEEIEVVANSAAATVDARLRSARTALECWYGTHATTYATALNGVLAAMVSFELALRARAAHLASFPDSGSTPAHHVTGSGGVSGPTAVPVCGPGTGADPEMLRRDVDASVGHRGVLAGMVGAVHVDGVTGTVEEAVPLSPAARQRYLDDGLPEVVVDQMRTTRTTVLRASEIADLIALAPVDDLLGPIVGPSQELEIFTSAVATAFAQADDGGLLGLLAFIPDASGLQQQTLAALGDGLLDAGASYEEVVAIVEELQHLSAHYPGVPAAVVGTFGAEGVDALQENLRSMTWSVPESQLVDEVLRPWSGIVATAVGELGDEQVGDFLAGLTPATVAALIASGRYDERFLVPAATGLVDLPPTLVPEPIGQWLYGGDLHVAAVMGLTSNESVAAQLLDKNGELLEWVATTDFTDHGEAAGVLLANVYYHGVLADLAADPKMDESLKASEKALTQLVPVGGFNDGSKVALAQIATLNFPALAGAASRSAPAKEGIGVVGDDALVDFYAELLGSPAAAEVTAAGFGAYTVAEFEYGAAHAVDDVGKGKEPSTFNYSAGLVGELNAMFNDALAQRSADHADEQAFWVGVGEAAIATGGRVGLAAFGIGGIGGAALTGAFALVAGWAGGAVSPPTFDLGARRASSELLYRAAVTKAMLDHPELLAETTLPATTQSELRADRFLDAVLAGDPDAIEAFETVALKRDNASFFGYVDGLTQEARLSEAGG